VTDATKSFPEQPAFRQPVLLDHGAHFPPPSQVPLFEQLGTPAVGSLLLELQRFFGSSVPAATEEQVPTFPATVQLLHSPFEPVVASLQALSQHTPSVQEPLEHWMPAVQAAPLVLSPQDLLAHV
jgi:hypothetical protein